jgi:hypothetical protein
MRRSGEVLFRQGFEIQAGQEVVLTAWQPPSAEEEASMLAEFHGTRLSDSDRSDRVASTQSTAEVSKALSDPTSHRDSSPGSLRVGQVRVDVQAARDPIRCPFPSCQDTCVVRPSVCRW